MAILMRPRELASGNLAVSQVESSSAWGAPLKGEVGTPEMPFIMRHWSNTGCSDLMMGGGELRKLSWFFGQNWSMMTP
jgi:hypothetical protein